MNRGPSPLLGYNTNVRHKGRLYHIQTEDSGVQRPHVMTHLFADGGRIIATMKTGYAEHVGSSDYPEIVKSLMREQHKAMFIALRDGVYDEDEAPKPAQESEAQAPAQAAGRYQATRSPMLAYESKALAPAEARGRAAMPAAVPPLSKEKSSGSALSEEAIHEKSLDELILSYLAEDLDALSSGEDEPS